MLTDKQIDKVADELRGQATINKEGRYELSFKAIQDAIAEELL